VPLLGIPVKANIDTAPQQGHYVKVGGAFHAEESDFFRSKRSIT
jgi:hypothetical protein